MSTQINKQQETSMPELENVRQENDGGAIAIEGFDYQFHFAAQKCLEMLAEPDKYEFVSSETHEDVVVRLKDGTYQFYQVKQKSNEQWDLSELKSRSVWANFIKVRKKFGGNDSYWFVSDQTAKHSTRRGKGKREPDLGQMKTLTQMGKDICSQNEKDKDNVAALLQRLDKDWDFNDSTETEAFFWSIRILTDHEHERGLESSNILKLQKLLEMRGINADSSNLSRIYDSITILLRRQVKAPDMATYEEAIEMRKIRPQHIGACVVGPFTKPTLAQFLLDDEHEEPQKRDLRRKTEKLNPNWAAYFIDSRNYFAVLYWQQKSYAASYIAHLRHAVWGVCHKHKVLANSDDKPIQIYRTILEGLDKLAEYEQTKQSSIDVTSEYLHGMMCQLTAECHHDWYPLD